MRCKHLKDTRSILVGGSQTSPRCIAFATLGIHVVNGVVLSGLLTSAEAAAVEFYVPWLIIVKFLAKTESASYKMMSAL